MSVRKGRGGESVEITKRKTGASVKQEWTLTKVEIHFLHERWTRFPSLLERWPDFIKSCVLSEIPSLSFPSLLMLNCSASVHFPISYFLMWELRLEVSNLFRFLFSSLSTHISLTKCLNCLSNHLLSHKRPKRRRSLLWSGVNYF